MLPLNASHSDVADRIVTTASQTITEAGPPAGWTLVGFTLKPNPNGTATCSPTEAFAGTSSVVPADANDYLICVRNDFQPPDRVIRIQKLTATAIHPAQIFGGPIAPGGPATSFAIQLPENGATAFTTVTLNTSAHTVTETPIPAGWTLVGYITKPDPDGTAACSPNESFSAGPAQVPAGTGRYLVCIRNDLQPPSERRVRIQKVTGTPTHPAQIFLGPIVPGGPNTGAWAVMLALNATHSDVADRVLTTAQQTITEVVPADWTLRGFTVKLDPNGTATCAAAESFTGVAAVVPADTLAYLVCVRNDFTPPSDRLIRIQKLTGTALHPAQAFGGPIAPGGPATSFAVQLPENAATAFTTVTLNTSAHTVTETPIPAGWTFVGSITLPDPDGTAVCSPFESFAPVPAQVPAGNGRYLVCFRNDLQPPSERRVRIQKVTGTAIHPQQIFFGPIVPGGTSTSGWAVMLAANASHSDVANRQVSTAAQTITESNIPAGWALVGFTVKPDPTGSATCAVGEAYAGTGAAVPAGANDYLVCVRNDVTAPPTRTVRVQKVTSTTHSSSAQFNGTVGGLPFVLTLMANASFSAALSFDVAINVEVPVVETNIPSGWSLVGYDVRLDMPPGSASCSVLGSFGPGSVVPANTQSYLVCIRNDRQAPAAGFLVIDEDSIDNGKNGGAPRTSTTTSRRLVCGGRCATSRRTSAARSRSRPARSATKAGLR